MRTVTVRKASDMPAYKRKYGGVMDVTKRRRVMRSLVRSTNKIYGGQGLGQAGAMLKVVRRISTTPTVAISLLPATGFQVTGLTTSFTLGMFFDNSGFHLYNPAVGTGTNVQYTFNNATSYNAIFDEYRVRCVNIKGYFSNNESLVTTTTTAIPLIYTALDFDGTTAATTAASVIAYENGKAHQVNATGRPFINRTIKWPRCTSSGILLNPGQYTDTASTNVSYGVVFAYDPQGATQATSIGQLTLVVSIEYDLKGVKN